MVLTCTCAGAHVHVCACSRPVRAHRMCRACGGRCVAAQARALVHSRLVQLHVHRDRDTRYTAPYTARARILVKRSVNLSIHDSLLIIDYIEINHHPRSRHIKRLTSPVRRSRVVRRVHPASRTAAYPTHTRPG